MIIILIYLIMSIFDFAVIAGTVYLIGWQSWNPWWMAFGLLIITGSNPASLLKIINKKHKDPK